MKKFVVGIFAAAALSSLGGFAQADAILEEKAYAVPVGDFTVQCSDSVGIGGNCFNVTGGSGVTVEVWDSAQLDAAGYNVGFYGPAGRIGALRPGCNTTSFDVPATATLMRVFVGVMNSSTNCETALTSVPPVGGTIYVTHHEIAQ